MQEVVDLFKHLENEVTILNFKYAVYKGIYEESEKQIDLLNKVAPISFRFFQDALMDDIILSLNRLLDPEAMRDEENISLQNFLSEVKENDLELYEKINTKIELLPEKYSDLRIHRHKRIVHNDKNSMMTKYALLPPIAIRTVVAAIDDVGNIIRDVSVHLWRQDILFDVTTDAASDAGKLIICIEDGTKA